MVKVMESHEISKAQKSMNPEYKMLFDSHKKCCFPQ